MPEATAATLVSASGRVRQASGVGLHVDQIDVTPEAARRLIDDQFPQWRHVTVQSIASTGTVNAIFRVGDGLAARFPLRRPDGVDPRAWVEAEAAAAREFAELSPVPAPIPVAIGAPGHGYPLPWAVQTWLPGRDAGVEDPAGSVAFAHDLSRVIASLRAADTRGRRFSGSGRGGDLTDHDAWLDVCFRESETLIDTDRLRTLWRGLRHTPGIGPDVMSHADLIPPNVLVRDGRLVGVLDTGGFGPADPALDLVAAWHLLERAPREELKRALGCGEVEWERGMAWALVQAAGLIWYYVESNPVMSQVGRCTLERILAET